MNYNLRKLLREIVNRFPYALLASIAICAIIYFNLPQKGMQEQTEQDSAEVISSSMILDSLTRRSPDYDSQKGDSIRQFTRQAIQRLSAGRLTKKKAEDFPWVTLPIAALVIFTLWYMYYAIRKLEQEELNVRDKDPEMLHRLFLAYFKEIVSLGTPRRIKRFSNRLRFQFNQLRLDKLLTDQNADDFFHDATKAEMDRIVFTLTFEEFKAHYHFKSSDKVLKKLYEYNVTILV